MTEAICEWCHKEVSSTDNLITLEWDDPRTGYSYWDVCYDCIDGFKLWMIDWLITHSRSK